MRCLLVLTMALVVGCIYAPLSLAQLPLENCANGLPKQSDFPEAAPSCKDRRRLAPIMVTPDVIFALTVRCGISVSVCNETFCYKSEEREKKQGVCDRWEEVKEQMSLRTICCDPKCEKPTPWFDGLSPHPKCKDRQQFKASHDKDGFVFLEACGWKVFANNLQTTDPLWLASYEQGLLQYVRARVGSTVCCDSFKAASRTGSSCDPRFDLDCDGTLNTTDHVGEHRDGTFPDITVFGIASGVPITDTDPLPPWFQPGDKDFMPAANLCDCKWELTRGKRTCSPDGRRPHEYQATWRCPSTGNVKFTRKVAPATESCGPEPEPTGSFLGASDRRYRDDISDSFFGYLRRYQTDVIRPCGS